MSQSVGGGGGGDVVLIAGFKASRKAALMSQVMVEAIVNKFTSF